ncbi:MAG: RNA-guided endonuclease IscB [Deltaproteobacteria bacterium]|nr:RNA-guided endonuclease IscB [Deltaproteobacteria bacterium]
MVKVIGKSGKQLMPTVRYGKVRRMLENGKAIIVSKNPFTIRLLFDTAEITQHVTVGVNPGDTTGYAVVLDNDKVIEKGEIRLRMDVKSLLAARKVLRRGRRSRNTRYRKARFLNRRKPEGWLPPSIRQKTQHIINKINGIISCFPDYTLKVEINKFDMQKLVNPDINGMEYQHGNLYGYENAKQFLLVRENGKCQLCRKGYKEGDGWHVHHIIPKPEGTNKPDNLALLHKSCHIKGHKTGAIKKLKKPKQYVAAAMYNAVRYKLMDEFKAIHGDNAVFTYGYITAVKRRELGLNKEHYNDAIAITGVETVKDNGFITITKQVRKKKRSLREATARKGRKIPNTKQIRSNKNTKQVCIKNKIYSLNDKVKTLGMIGYISGFTGKSAYIRDIDGNYLKAAGKSYKQIPLNKVRVTGRSNNWITERKAV